MPNRCRIFQLSHSVSATTGSVQFRMPRRCNITGINIVLHFQINAASTGFFGVYGALISGGNDLDPLIGGSPVSGKESLTLAFARKYIAQGTANANLALDLNQFFDIPDFEVGQGQILTWFLHGSAVPTLTGECYIYAVE